MKQILRYSFLALLAMVGLNLHAQGVTINFDDDYATLFPTLKGVSSSSGDNQNDGDFTETTTSTAVSGFTVTVSAAAEGVTNANRIWNAVPRLRMYSGTFTVTGKGIKKIEFTGHNTNFNLSTKTGTLEGKTWTGEADEVVFAVAKNTQINKIVINGDASSEDPTQGGGEEPAADVKTATCAEIIAGADGTTYRVTGTCTEIKNTTYGNWYLKDETGEVYIYGTLDADGKSKNFTSLNIEVGDIVTVVGPKKTYGETVELVDVMVEKIEKGQNPSEPVQTEEINVAKALEIINALEDNKTTSEEYQVKGKVISVTEISTQYGNATFVIADEATASTGLTVFRVKGFNGAPIDDENIVKVGDEVVVKGKLQKYVKDGNVTPELATTGSIISVNGVTTGIEALKAGEAEGAIYNLAGQRVEKAVKGLYIKNGKKFIVK